jgi:hypothetical protein
MRHGRSDVGDEGERPAWLNSIVSGSVEVCGETGRHTFPFLWIGGAAGAR